MEEENLLNLLLQLRTIKTGSSEFFFFLIVIISC